MISVKRLGQPLIRSKRTSGPDVVIKGDALKWLEQLLGHLPKFDDGYFNHKKLINHPLF